MRFEIGDVVEIDYIALRMDYLTCGHTEDMIQRRIKNLQRIKRPLVVTGVDSDLYGMRLYICNDNTMEEFYSEELCYANTQQEKLE